MTKVSQVIGIQKRVDGRIKVRQNDAEGDKIIGEATRFTKDFYCFYGVQRQPADGEEQNDDENIHCGLDFTSCRCVQTSLSFT